MLRIADRTARKLGLRVYRPNVKRTPLELLREYEQETGFKVVHQIKKALRNYSDGDETQFRIKKFNPVPHPAYEAKYNGPYSHIIHAWYNDRYGCVFGLRTDGKIVLWMD